MAIIACTSVRKSYGSVEALRGLDLRIETPGAYAVMGPSGSGKSTLLHLLAGLDVADGGEILVAGRNLADLNEHDLTLFRRHDIGIVFQGFNLMPTMTALQNVELPGVLASKPKGEMRDRAETLLEQLGLGDRMTHRPQALSGGEQQRVAIARALLFSPRVLYADEPTGNLDSRSSEQLWALLAQIASEREMTVVIVTHEPAAAAHCGTTFFLHDGVVAGTIDSGSLDATDLASEYQRLSRSS